MASTLRDRLKKLFTNNVVIKHMPGGRLKTYDISKSQSIGSPTTYSNRAKWRNGRSFNSVSGYGSGFTNEEIEAIRKQMYLDYEIMDTDAIISSALDIFAEEATTVDVDGQLLKIKTDDERIKKILHNLFYDIMNIEFNLWSWIRTMCKYGDFFLYLQIDEEVGIINVMPIHPSLMVRQEGSNEDPEMVKFKYEGDVGFYSNHNIFEAYEIAHFRMLTDTNFLPYGRSVIEPGKKTYKMMTLMEDAMLINRIMRAPERRIHYIDVGNLAPEEIDAHIEQVANEMRKTPYIDQTTGEYNLRYNLTSMMEDYYLPVRGENTGTKIDTLPGLDNDGMKEDVEYFKNKLLASLKIPKDFLGYGLESSGGKANLASLDIRFARTIERLQKIFVSELYKIAIVHLYTQGFKSSDLINFEIYLTNPSLVFERQKTDVMTAKVDLAKSIREENPLLSDKYIYENIFGMTEDEWKAQRDRIIEDSKFAFRNKQILEEGNDPNVSGKSFGTPWDIASMQIASRFNVNQEDSMKQMYTKDEREDNKGKPKQYKSSFETKRDQDFGRDPVGRRENDKMEMPSVSKESFQRFIGKLDRYKINTKQSLREKIDDDRVTMLNEELLFDDSELD